MKLKHSLIIEASNEYLFDLTQDYSKRKAWDSLIKDIKLLTPLPIGKGSQLEYTANNGLTMVVEYQNYQRPTIASIRMISDSRLFAHFGGGWQFKALDKHLTKVTFAYSFEIAVLPKLLNPIFAKIFLWENQKRFKALKKYAQTHYPNN